MHGKLLEMPFDKVQSFYEFSNNFTEFRLSWSQSMTPMRLHLIHEFCTFYVYNLIFSVDWFLCIRTCSSRTFNRWENIFRLPLEFSMFSNQYSKRVPTHIKCFDCICINFIKKNYEYLIFFDVFLLIALSFKALRKLFSNKNALNLHRFFKRLLNIVIVKRYRCIYAMDSLKCATQSPQELSGQ